MLDLFVMAKYTYLLNYLSVAAGEGVSIVSVVEEVLKSGNIK